MEGAADQAPQPDVPFVTADSFSKTVEVCVDYNMCLLVCAQIGVERVFFTSTPVHGEQKVTNVSI